MKRFQILALILLPMFGFSAKYKSGEAKDKITFEPRDREILENILSRFVSEKEIPISELLVKIGISFCETPYVAHTLEKSPENLLINLRELDCTTFAENCLAITRTVKGKNPSFKSFTDELRKIRYRNGLIENYTSRIHYFSDWIFENGVKKRIRDVNEEIAKIPYPLQVNFMSKHPESYKQLKENTALLPVIVNQENIISKRKMHYIPEDQINKFEESLKDGDIAGITTNIKGMDIQHVVILMRKNGKIHMLHASQTAGKVLISDETLEDYLLKSKSATGIMVARPI